MEETNRLAVLTVGKVYEPFTRLEGESHFDIDASGLSLVLKYNQPTPKELEQITAGHPFEIRFVELKNIIFVTFKCGSLPWCDAPFDPQLLNRPIELEYPSGKSGYGLMLVLCDENGVVRHIRYLGLRAGFSRAFLAQVSKIMEGPSDTLTSYLRVQEVYGKYSTADLVRMSKDYCKVDK